jgi:hypothetical protein
MQKGRVSIRRLRSEKSESRRSALKIWFDADLGSQANCKNVAGRRINLRSYKNDGSSDKVSGRHLKERT